MIYWCYKGNYIASKILSHESNIRGRVSPAILIISERKL